MDILVKSESIYNDFASVLGDDECTNDFDSDIEEIPLQQQHQQQQQHSSNALSLAARLNVSDGKFIELLSNYKSFLHTQQLHPTVPINTVKQTALNELREQIELNYGFKMTVAQVKKKLENIKARLKKKRELMDEDNRKCTRKGGKLKRFKMHEQKLWNLLVRKESRRQVQNVDGK